MKTTNYKNDYYNTESQELEQERGKKLTTIIRETGSGAVKTSLAFILGKGTKGIALSFFLDRLLTKYEYWRDKGLLHSDGSFFWTTEDCEFETQINESTQKRYLKELSTLNILKISEGRNPNDPMKKVRFIQMNELQIHKLIKEADKKYNDQYKKIIERKNKQENSDKPSNDATGQNELSGEVKMNCPERSKWSITDTYITDTDLTNTYKKSSSNNDDRNNDENPSVSDSENTTTTAIINRDKIDSELKEQFPNVDIDQAKEMLKNKQHLDTRTDNQYRASLRMCLEDLSKPKRSKQPIRKEMLPSWLNKKDKPVSKYGTDRDQLDFSKGKDNDLLPRAEFEEMLRQEEAEKKRLEFEAEKKQLFDRIKDYKIEKGVANRI